MKTFRWRKENGFVVLSGWLGRDIRYDEDTLIKAISGVRDRKGCYHNKQDYYAHLTMLEQGLDLIATPEHYTI